MLNSFHLVMFQTILHFQVFQSNYWLILETLNVFAWVVSFWHTLDHYVCSCYGGDYISGLNWTKAGQSVTAMEISVQGKKEKWHEYKSPEKGVSEWKIRGHNVSEIVYNDLIIYRTEIWLYWNFIRVNVHQNIYYVLQHLH